MIPKKYEPFLFSLILSGAMSLLISGISTFHAAGLADHFVGLWFGAWLPAWLVAFPAVMLIAPLARKAVQRLLAQEW